MAVAGLLACQENSYLKEITTKVSTCKSTKAELLCIDGKTEEFSGYEVTLEDTVLFPEGGGQPDDRGMIDNLPVFRVERRQDNVVHFLEERLEEGSEVTVQVDWLRRWDHMQQHTGQHLITAIADSLFGYPTTSWYLGKSISTIELDTPSLSAQQISVLEDSVNAKILDSLKVFPTVYSDKLNPDLAKVRTRGLPNDHVGPVRVVTIDSIETNMCCGTHLSNTSHLQCIKILGKEKAKKGKTNISFLAGDRVRDFIELSLSHQAKLTAVLKGGMSDHCQLAEKLVKNCKDFGKINSTLLKELAVAEAELFKKSPKSFFEIHRREGDMDYMMTLSRELSSKGLLVFITVGDDSSAKFLLTGPSATLDWLSPRVLELLDGKGNYRNGRLQGKAGSLGKREQVIELMQQASDQRTEELH